MLKIITWNVNGIKSSQNELEKLIKDENPDVICLQEIKTKYVPMINNYDAIANPCAKRANYHGTCIYVRKSIEYTSVQNNIACCYDEGREITLYLPTFDLAIVNVYVPNSGVDKKNPLKRLDLRVQEWDLQFSEYVKSLNTKSVIVAGDLNVALHPMDVHNPKTLTKKAGFTLQERLSYQKHLGSFLTDGYRLLNPQKTEFTFYGKFGSLKELNKGWRLDYLLHKNMNLKSIKVLKSYESSDHVPLIGTYE